MSPRPPQLAVMTNSPWLVDMSLYAHPVAFCPVSLFLSSQGHWTLDLGPTRIQCRLMMSAKTLFPIRSRPECPGRQQLEGTRFNPLHVVRKMKG